MQFSLFRLLLMVTVFATVLGLAKWAELGMAGAVVMAAAIGGLVLLVSRKDIPGIAYSVVFSGSAVLIAVPFGNFYALALAALSGWLAGCLALRLDDRIKTRREAENRSAKKEK